MVVLKILILFLPLLLAEAKYKIGPFHRYASNSWDSSTTLTNSPVDHQDLKPSQHKLPQYEHIDDRLVRQRVSQPVHEQPVTTEKLGVDPVTSPPKVVTDSPVEIHTTKSAQAESVRSIYEYPDNRYQNPRAYYAPKPISNPWVPRPSVDILRTSQPIQLPPSPPLVTPVSLDSSVQKAPEVSTDRKKFSADPEVEEQTPKPTPPEPIHSINTGNEVNNYLYLNRRPAPRLWVPPTPPTNSSARVLPALDKLKPVSVDDRRHIENGPYHRPQRSADPWGQQPWDTYSKDVQSNSWQIELTTEHPESQVLRFKCPKPWGYYKYSEECGEYIECKNYVPLAFMCPEGLHFNPLANWMEYPCEDPSKVQCNKESESTTMSSPARPPSAKVVTTPRPSYQNPNFMCPQQYGYFKFSDQCGEYIECKNYVPLMFTCPAGLHFNVLVEWTQYPCDHPSIVQCPEPEEEKTPPPPPPTTRAPPTTTRRPLPPPTTRPPPPPITWRPPPPPTTRPPPPTTTWRPPPPTWRPPPTTWLPPTRRPPPPTTRPPPPTTRRPPPPPPTTRRPPPPPPTTRRPPPPPPTTRRPPPPPPTTRPPTTPGHKNPPNFNICKEQNGYFKFSNRCEQYIECKNYVPQVFTCPEGLHFNPEAEWTEYPCDYPSKVQCIAGPADPEYPPTTQLPPMTTPHSWGTLNDFECPVGHGYFQHSDQCEEYVECKNHVPLKYKCPDGLHFNIYVHWTEYPCDDPSKAQCNKLGSNKWTENPHTAFRPVVTQSPQDPTTAVTPYIPRFPTEGTIHPSTERPPQELMNYYCQEPNAYYPVAYECDSYVECKNYRAIQYVCPNGLYYNSKAQWPHFPCDDPSKVVCNSGQFPHDPIIPTTHPTPRPTIATPRPTIAPPRPTIATPRPTIGAPRPTIATPRPTIATPRPTIGTYWPTLENSTPTNLKQIFNYSCPESNGFYSIASQCDIYVECKDDIATEHSCPDGLHFNSRAQWPDYPCGYPSEVKCDSGDVVQQANPTADCPHRDGFFPTDNDDCGEYMVCHAGVAIIEHCPAGLVFNFEKDICDWPVNVPTCDRPRALDGVVCPAPPVLEEDELTIYKYKYGNSCKYFVACQEGQPRLLSCDGDEHFNEETQSCVDSSLVTDCSD